MVDGRMRTSNDDDVQACPGGVERRGRSIALGSQPDSGGVNFIVVVGLQKLSQDGLGPFGRCRGRLY
jgi:hypothetical protein